MGFDWIVIIAALVALIASSMFYGYYLEKVHGAWSLASVLVFLASVAAIEYRTIRFMLFHKVDGGLTAIAAFVILSVCFWIAWKFMSLVSPPEKSDSGSSWQGGVFD
jgi:predicted permease